MNMKTYAPKPEESAGVTCFTLLIRKLLFTRRHLLNAARVNLVANGPAESIRSPASMNVIADLEGF
jgi:hypothetical protein